jgi:uncharacterized protein YybS (DUF2232 family)
VKKKQKEEEITFPYPVQLVCGKALHKTGLLEENIMLTLFIIYSQKSFVVPIPDFWMILCAALVGKCTLIILEENAYRQKQLRMVLGGATLVYILVSLQIYISWAILIPCFFPIVVFWSYLIGGRNHES